MKLYNTLTRNVEEFVPLHPHEVGMYACGLTPYDYSHLGHAMQGIIFDVIRRYLEFKGYEVTYVRNYTDIDDKIIKAAAERNIDPLDWSKRMIDAAEEDFRKLEVASATYTPLVSGNISQIIGLIQMLIDKGFAYITSEGNVYFRVHRFKNYGKLSHQKTEDLFEGTRKDTEPDKENAKDFALWKASKPDEPWWDSPWGHGRPGWHIECSVMSKRYLGETFDIHGGGKDLIFPHHENEIAQSEAAHGKTFARFWIHNGMMTLNGEKMSKSTKSYVLIRDALKEFHPQAIRYLVLTNHYRSNQEYNRKRFRDGQMRLYYYYKTLLEQGYKYLGTYNKSNHLVQTFSALMDNDLDSVRVFSLLDQQFKKLNSNQLTEQDKADIFGLLNAVGKVFGVLDKEPRLVVEEIRDLELAKHNTSRPDIERMVQERRTLRSKKDYAGADKLRDELFKAGVTVLDIDGSTAWDPIFLVIPPA
jgi:cysteinyl-tRNA synthetase